jgi:OmpA-OmpF porin, OOP family
MFRPFVLISAVLLAALHPTTVTAQPAPQDHPLVSRLPGSEIKVADVKQFDEITLPMGRFESKKNQFAKTQRLEGKITRIQYVNPKDRSSLEIVRSYQQALQKAGFQILFACGHLECADGSTLNYEAPGARDLRGWCVDVGIQCPDPMRYVFAKLARDTGDVYVAVQVWNPDTYLRVVEVKPMEAGLVTVKAEAMKSDITAAGHTPIYGVYFDTGKAEIKPNSDASLAEIAKLLKADTSMKLHIVGHTDNVGTPASNMELSKQRAAAVTNALVTKHGIASARLDSAGVGALAPVATNRTEEGRAKNRRVELVEQ